MQDKTGHDALEILKPLVGTQTVESYGLKHEDKLTAVFDGKLYNKMLSLCKNMFKHHILLNNSVSVIATKFIIRFKLSTTLLLNC